MTEGGQRVGPRSADHQADAEQHEGNSGDHVRRRDLAQNQPSQQDAPVTSCEAITFTWAGCMRRRAAL
jgi:hypothetical protein